MQGIASIIRRIDIVRVFPRHGRLLIILKNYFKNFIIKVTWTTETIAVHVEGTMSGMNKKTWASIYCTIPTGQEVLTHEEGTRGRERKSEVSIHKAPANITSAITS